MAYGTAELAGNILLYGGALASIIVAIVLILSIEPEEPKMAEPQFTRQELFSLAAFANMLKRRLEMEGAALRDPSDRADNREALQDLKRLSDKALQLAQAQPQ